MTYPFGEIAFTDAVRREQERHGSASAYARQMERPDDPAAERPKLGAREAAFIAARDSFYMASVSETGWPYMQHRGGPLGFVRALDDGHIGFLDYRGNRQYVSVGNLLGNDRVSLFFMDYANRTRLKLLGRARILEGAEAIAPFAEQLATPGYRAHAERAILIAVEATDWNCPQHITQRFTMPEIERAILPLQQRIAELEAALAARENT